MMQDENCLDWGFHCPLIDKTIKALEGVENLQHCGPLKEALVGGMLKRFEGYKCMKNLVATMLHPAFKKEYVCKNIEGISADLVIDKIVQALDRNTANNQNSGPPAASEFRQLRHLSLFYEDSEIAVPDPVQSSSKQLLESYFSEADKSLAVLLQTRYEPIKKLFIEYNTQLLSSASSERLFSLGKHILLYTRTCLADKNFEKLVILNSCTKHNY